MGLKSSLLIAWRSLSRRKTKNLSAILAVTLGVTLLVGIQITTDTLQNSFLTSLLQSQGEVDLQIANVTSGAYLKASDQATISSLLPDALGVMPELSTQIPALVESQFDPKMPTAGIPIDYPEAFGTFYDWKTGNQMNPSALLTDNTSILLSSKQAEKLGLTKDTPLPITLTTEFTNLTVEISPPPTVPLSRLDGKFQLHHRQLCISTATNSDCILRLTPTTPFSMVTVFTINGPRLTLSDYTYINITATGSDNARIVLGFSTETGSTITIANMTDITTLTAAPFDLEPYAGEIMRGDFFCSVMSANGTQATVDISKITFGTLSPIISYVPETARIELKVVGIFDSKPTRNRLPILWRGLQTR